MRETPTTSERAIEYADTKDAKRGGVEGEGTKLLRDLVAELAAANEAIRDFGGNHAGSVLEVIALRKELAAEREAREKAERTANFYNIGTIAHERDALRARVAELEKT